MAVNIDILALDQSDVRKLYSQSVAFYRLLLDCGQNVNSDLMCELRWIIEDSFLEISEKDMYSAEGKENDDLAIMWYEQKSAWLDEHPEWFTQDVLLAGVL